MDLVSVRQQADKCIIKFNDDLIGSISDDFQSAYMNNKNAKYFELDFGSVSRIDSKGFGMLIDMHDQVGSEEDIEKITITNASDSVKQLLEGLHIDRVLRIV